MQTDSREQQRKALYLAYWRANLRLSLGLLVPWFVVSFGFGILLRDWLDQFSIGTAPLGFWFAQQGSIICFVVIIFAYCWGMDRIDRKYRVPENLKEE